MNTLSGREIVAFDALGAPFWYDLDRLVAPSSEPWFGTQFSDFMSAPALERPADDTGPDRIAPPVELRLDLGETPDVAGIGHASLARDSLSLTMSRAGGNVATAFTTEGIDNLLPASGASLSWSTLDASLALRVGWFSERQSMLSTTAEGAFGALAAHSVSLGLEIDQRVGDWRLSGGPEVGVVHARAQDGIIAAFRRLRPAPSRSTAPGRSERTACCRSRSPSLCGWREATSGFPSPWAAPRTAGSCATSSPPT